MSEDEPKLTDLPNIGVKLALELEQAGICTPSELRAIGAKEAFLRLRMRDNTACLCKLSALEGAVRGMRWHDFDCETKSELKKFYKSL